MAKPGDELRHPITGERIVWRQVARDTDGALLQADLFASPQASPAAGDRTDQAEGRRGRTGPSYPQEFAIATLAASGMTNKQIAERLFLSHRTVGGHLHRAFPKLGIATRAALRDALAFRLARTASAQPAIHPGAIQLTVPRRGPVSSS